jgi:hypothetical protein
LEKKKLMDLRGPQSRIGRLLPFLFEGWLHMLLYRIMVPLSIVYGLFVAAYLLAPAAGLGGGAEARGAWGISMKAFTVVVWVLWTPQFYEVFKGLSLAWSRGMAFGHLNAEFAALYRKRYRKRIGGYVALPYVVLALWIAGLVILILRWFP